MTRYRFIDQAKQQLGARRCCRVLGVSPSSYHHWRRRVLDPSARQRATSGCWGRSPGSTSKVVASYGAPRVHAELQIACGVEVGRKRVARLMRSAGLVGCHRRRRWRPGLTRRDRGARPAPDLCQRQFSPPQLNRLRHADYTELPTDQGTLYLVAVVDGCSRLAVGHAMGEHATAELAIAAVELAVWRRGLIGRGLVHHSDQGSQPGVREAAAGAGDPPVDGVGG